MRNTLLTGLMLLSTGAWVTAQQHVIGVTPPAPPLAPAAGVQVVTTGSGNAQSYYYSSDNNRPIREEDLKSKEISKEIVAPKNGDIYIEITSRNIVVKSWDQQKVKVSTTVYYEGEGKLSDDEWFEKVNLSLKTLGTSVKIKSGTIGGSSVFFSNGGSVSSTSTTSGVAIFNGAGQNVGTKANMKRIVTVYVPAGSKLDVESKYSDVTLPDVSGDVNVDITNGNIEGGSFSKLILRSKYSNINIGDVKTAEVEMTNGRFSAKTIDDLDIDSKYSTVEMASVKKITLRSTNDEYELEDAGEVRGRKNYGNLRITKLNTSLELDGSNADVKVRKVGAGLGLVKIDDRYADVRIPLRDTKNYTVDFAGNYSSVYGSFEKKPLAAEEKTGSTRIISDFERTPLARAGSSSWDNSNPSRFTATVGDGKGLKIDIKCQNCTVDFK